MCAFCLSHAASIESWKFSSNGKRVALCLKMCHLKPKLGRKVLVDEINKRKFCLLNFNRHCPRVWNYNLKTDILVYIRFCLD